MIATQQVLLLVEEDPTLADMTAFRLELHGYQVVALHSAEEAQLWLADQLPDLLIIGLFLPGMGGIDFLNQLSNDMRTAEVPTVLLSPNSDLEDVQKAFNAGAKEYLVTPFDPCVLEEKIERLIQTTTLMK